MMKLKNTGRRRLRIGRTLYIGPGEIVELADSDGEYFLMVHGDLINVTTKKKKKLVKKEVKPEVKIKIEPKVDPIVEEYIDKNEDNLEVNSNGIE